LTRQQHTEVTQHTTSCFRRMTS